jgi:hypothetical protein
MGEIGWRTGWDRRVHAFAAFGEVSSQAACGHIGQTSKLRERVPDDELCPACAFLEPLALQQLAGPLGHERDRWAT